MKRIFLRIVIVYVMFFSSAIVAGTSTSSTVTNTQTAPVAVTNSNGTTQMSTTYSTTTSTTSNSKDDDIVSAVYAKYAKDPALIGTALTVNSQNGVVTINGTVTGQAQADEASIAAKSISGVKDVRSNINVTTNPNLNDKSVKTPKLLKEI